MAEFKLVISDPKSGKSMQREAKDDAASKFLNQKIGTKIKGEVLDLTGYEFEITGGSDKSGFPMRRDVEGRQRKQILAVKGVGLKPIKKKRRKNKVFQKYPGTRVRKSVRGNTIGPEISQINLKITKQGSASLFEEAKSEDKPTEEKKEAPVEKKETPKPEEKKEVKVEEKKEESPKEETKPEEKVEEKKEEAKPEEPKQDDVPKKEEPKEGEETSALGSLFG